MKSWKKGDVLMQDSLARINSTLAPYNRSIDEAIARYASTRRLTQLTDQLGSVIRQINEAGTTQSQTAYSPYGEASTTGDDQGNSTEYTGRENDDTGLYFYRARYYDPALKRWISDDPIGVAGGTNLSAYVAGRPTSTTDSLGLAPQYCGQCATTECLLYGGNICPPPQDDTSACSYYTKICQEQGCKYHCEAQHICKGELTFFSLAANGVNNLICGANANNRNCIRKCLVREDAKARKNPKCNDQCSPGGGCTKTECINEYHETCFEECGISKSCYLGDDTWIPSGKN